MHANTLCSAGALRRLAAIVVLAVSLGGCGPKTASVPHDGRLLLTDLRSLDSAQVDAIDPASEVPRNILLFAFDGDWTLAKRVLILGEWPAYARRVPLADDAAPRALMRKLIAFRQLDHERHLRAVRADMGLDEDALWWNASGSTSLTSDIDVNLEGTGTEDFVEHFNRRFAIAAGYGLESGLVYDVNVYAEDFLFGVVEVALPDGGSALVARDEYQITSAPARAADALDQEQWALVHMRLHMTDGEWSVLRDAMAAEPGGAAQLRGAEIKFGQFRREMVDEVLRNAGASEGDVNLDPRLPPMAALHELAAQVAGHDTWAENLLLASSNRVYEGKLDAVAALRAALDSDSVSGDAAARSRQVAELRSALSEATLFSNEAYTTDGAVNHAVLGLQIGEPIRQTRSASMHAFFENIGDTMKALERHDDDFGEALLESSKYLWRAGDALHNARWEALQQPEATGWRAVGHEIAQNIRKDASLSRQQQRQRAVAAFEAYDAGIDSVPVLRDHVLRIATSVGTQWLRVGAATRRQLGLPVSQLPAVTNADAAEPM